jgi:hypothetical protein
MPRRGVQPAAAAGGFETQLAHHPRIDFREEPRDKIPLSRAEQRIGSGERWSGEPNILLTPTSDLLTDG